jgi:prepilin-type N-terminal cleavage/methylation domain-containing protein
MTGIIIQASKILNHKLMKLSKGFTLIELIVVMAIFLFVIGAAVSIFISIVQYQKRVLSEQELLNQISYTEEYMSKALRMAKTELNEDCLTDSQNNDYPGYIYLLTRYDQQSGLYQGIKFINQSEFDPVTGLPICQEFFLDNCDPTNPNAKVLCEKKGNNSPIPLTPANLNINSVKFSIDGADGSTSNGSCPNPPLECGASESDTTQPRVSILLSLQIPGDSTEPTRIIQTTISQRNLNVK